jgi:ribonuclease BN (tRNA processing enzyme)
MKITIVGSGNAFSFKNYNTCFLLEEDNKKLLIDCGGEVPQALHDKLNLSYKDIDAIYVSHSHADHIGGLEKFGFARYDWVNKPRLWNQSEKPYAPVLIGNATLLLNIWQRSLRGGMDTLEFQTTLETFFHTLPIDNNEFYWQGWDFKLIRNLHGEGNNKYSYGLYGVRPNYPSVYFTTDSRFDDSSEKIELYRKADRIFQDCECTPYLSGAHANYQQLVTLPTDIKKKMYLTHYQDSVYDGGDENKYEVRAELDGFVGFIEPGEIWYLSEVNK